MGSRRSFLRNSLSNAINGFSSAVLTLGLPPILSRTMEPAAFSAWTLVLQIAAYTAILNFGLQNGVSRYVAYHAARGDETAVAQVTSTGFAILLASAIIAVTCILLAAGYLPQMFSQLPEAIAHESALTLIIVGTTLAAGLPICAFLGSFLGHQRNDLVAWVQGGARLVLALLVAITAILSGNMVAMAMMFAIVYALSYGLTIIVHHTLGFRAVSPAYVTAGAARELWAYSGTLVVWMLATWLINGLDTVLVGKFDFTAVGVYGSCAGLILVIGGVQSALFGPLLQVVASNQGTEQTSELPELLTTVTRLNGLLLLTIAAPTLLFAKPLLSIWLGPAYGTEGAIILSLIIVGNTIRLIWMPYALMLVATLRHKQVLVTPIVAGVVNAAVAALGGWLYGAVGVTAGVIVGALAEFYMHLNVNIPHTQEITPNRSRLLKEGFLRPLLCFAPALLALLSLPNFGGTALGSALSALGLLMSAVLVWNRGFSGEERTRISAALRLSVRPFSNPS